MDELYFPPIATDRAVQDTLLVFTASMLAKKYDTKDFTYPAIINYRNITMFGGPKLKKPSNPAKPNAYQASVLSFITRATTGSEVLWIMKTEVVKNGESIFSREIKHELINYEGPGLTAGFTAGGFVETYKTLFCELLEISPPLAYKFILGAGIDYDSVLRANSEPWPVNKNQKVMGFWSPDFGSYKTLAAEKLDTAVIKKRTKVGTDSYLDFAGSSVFFDQFKTVDYSKTKFCTLLLGTNTGSMRALFAISTERREAHRTIAGQLFGGSDEVGSNSQLLYYNRNVMGTIATDSIVWDFLVERYGTDGIIGGGYMVHDTKEYLLEYRHHAWLDRDIILKGASGEIFASLVITSYQTSLFIRKDLDATTQNAIATLYAIIMSVKNID